MELREKIYNEFVSGKLAFKSVGEIINLPEYRRPRNLKRLVREKLGKLVKSGALIVDRKNKLCTPKQAEAFTGTVQSNPRGFAFILPDDKSFGKDFFVPAISLAGAYDGDKVMAIPVKGTPDEAYIVRILERGRKQVVGTFFKRGDNGLVKPDYIKLPDVIVPLPLSLNAKSESKVVCEITKYPKDGTPIGKVIEILGESGDFDVEELSIIRSYDLREEFPENVTEEAEQASKESIVVGNRRDLRDELIFTIDGDDTRDIDDGVSLTKDGRKYILGVHIADVSNYVKFRSELDNEAYARGTSVYFPDRVLPMLPRSLSNGACSLNEGEDRYALSCVMTFNEKGVRQSYEVFESVIQSRHKMTYKKVTAICEGDRKVRKEYRDIVKTVENMQKLCLLLEGRRENDGEVELDVKETKIYVDENNEIVIPEYTRTISERMIEQFMISANEAVAEFLQNNKAPCLYRIHEQPSPEKAEQLSIFVKELGINTNFGEKIEPKDFQNLLKQAEDKPFASVVNKVMLRSMQKARYSEKNLGHFGLASKCYCHFTSPIRRYPDLFVHRVLKDIFHGGKNLERYSKIAHNAGIKCSEHERNADEAERAVDDLYILVYMSDRIGESYDATISGVTKHGVFCELKNTIEGVIPVEYLPQDDYVFIGERMALKGKKHSFKLGKPIKVKVDNCDFGRMKVILSLDEEQT
jgi:ribonuclease R